MSLSKSTLLKYYKRKDVQEALILHAKDKEIGIRYEEAFGKRPDTLTYPRDVLELALKNATSFHASEELWANPLSLSSSLSKKDMDELRTGWDLVLDVDCALLEYSKLCAYLIVKFLEYCGVISISIKFSGNKGFHIGIPFEAFPEKIGNTLTKDLFPEAPKKIAFYVKENIKDALSEKILQFEQGNFAAIKEKVKLPREEIIRYHRNEWGNSIEKLNVDPFLEIDTILLSPRHLYRMPYSLHEKSGLVSIPVDPQKILEFNKAMATPEQIVVSSFPFLDRTAPKENARRLLIQALDFKSNIEEEIKKKEDNTAKKQTRNNEEFIVKNPITEQFFPPCIKLILQGLEDGKKRGIFCLSNYLGKIGWSKQEIEDFIKTWNTEKNRNPLREVYIKGQLQHFKAGEKLPPNCNNEAYYKNIGVCKPDAFCSRIKNPANYTILKWKRHLQEKEEIEEKESKKIKKKSPT